MSDNFFDKVYKITRKIPFGKVSTYGAVARHIGSPQAARMVGWALNKCGSQKEFVPAHRVVNRNGLLTGKQHFANFNTMIELLESEGIKIVDNQIIDFEKHLWKPSEEEMFIS